MLMPNFGVTNKEHYGMLCYFPSDRDDLPKNLGKTTVQECKTSASGSPISRRQLVWCRQNNLLEKICWCTDRPKSVRIRLKNRPSVLMVYYSILIRFSKICFTEITSFQQYFIDYLGLFRSNLKINAAIFSYATNIKAAVNTV